MAEIDRLKFGRTAVGVPEAKIGDLKISVITDAKGSTVQVSYGPDDKPTGISEHDTKFLTFRSAHAPNDNSAEMDKGEALEAGRKILELLVEELQKKTGLYKARTIQSSNQSPHANVNVAISRLDGARVDKKTIEKDIEDAFHARESEIVRLIYPEKIPMVSLAMVEDVLLGVANRIPQDVFDTMWRELHPDDATVQSSSSRK